MCNSLRIDEPKGRALSLLNCTAGSITSPSALTTCLLCCHAATCGKHDRELYVLANGFSIAGQLPCSYPCLVTRCHMQTSIQALLRAPRTIHSLAFHRRQANVQRWLMALPLRRQKARPLAAWPKCEALKVSPGYLVIAT